MALSALYMHTRGVQLLSGFLVSSIALRLTPQPARPPTHLPTLWMSFRVVGVVVYNYGSSQWPRRQARFCRLIPP